MNLQNRIRALAAVSMFALAAVGIGGMGSIAANAQGLSAEGAESPSGANAQFQCAACVKLAENLTLSQDFPNLQVRIVSTSMSCDQVYPNDPDTCQWARFTVNIQVTNRGSEASPATSLEWRCCIGTSGYLDATRPVPALAPGQSESDSWQVRPYLVAPGLPPGSCDDFAIQLSPLGGAPHLGQYGTPTVQTSLCNSLG
jgi:hypothetical protein